MIKHHSSSGGVAGARAYSHAGARQRSWATGIVGALGAVVLLAGAWSVLCAAPDRPPAMDGLHASEPSPSEHRKLAVPAEWMAARSAGRTFEECEAEAASSRKFPAHGLRLEAVTTQTAPQFQMTIVDPSFDQAVSKKLKLSGQFDSHILAMLSHVQQRATQSAATPLVLDVGANLGFFGLLSAHRGFRTIAFEMQPLMQQCIAISQCMYPDTLAELLVVVPGVVSELDGEPYAVQKPLKGGNLGGIAVGCDSGRPEDCDSVLGKRIDTSVREIARERGWSERVAIMKLDVEGFELHAILSMTRLLEAGLVDNIAMEFTPGHVGLEKSKALLHYLRALGYSLYLVPFTEPASGVAWPAERLKPVLDIDEFSAFIAEGRDGRWEGMTDLLATRDPASLGLSGRRLVLPGAAMPGTL